MKLTKKKLVEAHMMVSQMSLQGFDKHSDQGVATALAYAKTVVSELDEFAKAAREELSNRGCETITMVPDLEKKVVPETQNRREFDPKTVARICKQAGRMAELWESLRISSSAIDEHFPDGDEVRAKIISSATSTSSPRYSVRSLSKEDRKALAL